MNKLPLAKRAQILGLLFEGNSLRATSRLADCSINTMTRLLVDAGTACAAYQDNALRNLPCKRVQVDEFCAFCYAKAKNVETAKAAPEEAGDIWTWIAICAETKLVMSWLFGGRDAGYAQEFVEDLKGRMSSRIQLTSNGHRANLEAIESTFGGNVDYAQLVKIYGASSEGQNRYSSAECIGARKDRVISSPDMTHVSTSFAERQNHIMRMSMRRFTRLTNASSKKAENHGHAVALHLMYYNFGRIHKTLRLTPAMAAGVSDHLWSLDEIAGLADSIQS